MADPIPSRSTRPDRCTLVIFGASGDLTRRKLLPALYNLRCCYGALPPDCAILGVARTDLDDRRFRDKTRDVRGRGGRPVDDEVRADFANRLYYLRGDYDDPSTYQRLGDKLGEIDAAHETGRNLIFYLATPPSQFGPIVDRLGEAGLAREEEGAFRRVVVEKPLGRDLESAVALNQRLRSVLDEHQIYRIDHYLGKETVQNILVFRFANGLFEPIWNRRYIDHVQITVSEEIGIERRGGYYERAGALRDVVQNHMLTLLALIAMEPPSTLGAEAVRNEMVKVLDSIRPLSPEGVLTNAVRGQYGEGPAGGAKVPAYRSEGGVSPASQTETYAALKLDVENWRWAGVPFYLRSGKRLATRYTEVAIQFRRPPLLLFREAGVAEIEPNRLIIRIQPDEAISLKVKAKRPGPAIQLENVKLAFSYRDLGDQSGVTGYERLLHDCMIGDSTLFQRADMVEASWRIVTPILEVWASLPARDFPNYAAGSPGPAAADDLLGRDGRKWLNPG